MDLYKALIGKKVMITTGYFSSTVGQLVEYDKDKFLFKVAVGMGWVVVGLDDIKLLDA
jgi:transcription antitermination factor NusG